MVMQFCIFFQEGPRYSAMHVAAIKNQSAICQTILDILENPEFVSKLYSQSVNTEETMNSRINFLVDLYLNMPDKGVRAISSLLIIGYAVVAHHTFKSKLQYF